MDENPLLLLFSLFLSLFLLPSSDRGGCEMESEQRRSASGDDDGGGLLPHSLFSSLSVEDKDRSHTIKDLLFFSLRWKPLAQAKMKDWGGGKR